MQDRHHAVDEVGKGARSGQVEDIDPHSGAVSGWERRRPGEVRGAEHAEAVFISGTYPSIAQVLVTDLRARAVENGRKPDDLRIFQGLGFVLGSTEAEARQKHGEFDDYLSEEGHLTVAAGSFGIGAVANVDTDGVPRTRY